MINPTQYKPVKPEDFIGKTRQIATVLFAKIEKLKTAPAPVRWLFYGPPGVGKTALAEALAQHKQGIRHINGQSCSVDVVRAWQEETHYLPMLGVRTVCLIDELDAASPAAQMQMLTWLDTLPNHWAIIATTNEELNLLQRRLQSRFSPWKFEPIPEKNIALLLANWNSNPIANLETARNAKGDVRQALGDLENLMDLQEAKP